MTPRAVLATFLALAGCSDDGEPLPIVVVAITPADLSTGRALFGRIAVAGGAEVDVALVEWPGGAAVPAMVFDVSSDEDAADGRRQLEIEPSSDLPDGWYAIRVRASEEGARLGHDRWLLSLDRGREIVSRFGLGQAPIVAALEADSGTQVRARFSERVSVPERSVAVRQNGNPCVPSTSHPGATDAIVFECAARWPADVELEVGTGIAAGDGRALAPVSVTGRLDAGETLFPPGGPPAR